MTFRSFLARSMTFRAIVTRWMFILFVLLSGAELLENLRNSAQKDMEFVQYTRSMDSTEQTPEKKPSIDIEKMLEASDVEG